MSTGLFAGSFDPYTIGHDSVARRAMRLFDRLVIGVGVNDAKHYRASAEERVKAIRNLYKDMPQVEVVEYSDCTVNLAQRVGAEFIVKGVRNIRDYEYERDQAEINRMIGNVETVLLFTEPGLGSVSSSVVRELEKLGKPVEQFLPKRR